MADLFPTLRRFRSAGLVAGAALLAACGGPPPAADTLVLVSIDTLRPDRLGCYGGSRPTSPRLDALCAESVVFEQAIAAAPSTLPSHATLLTGLSPLRHGASMSRRRALPAEIETVAERLAAAGFRTASFNDGGQVDARWGLDQGFEVYRSFESDLLAPIVDAGLAWLDEVRAADPDGRVFLFLHTYQVHHPYRPRARDLAALGAAPYDGALGPTVGYRELLRINRQRLLPAPEDLAFIDDAYDAEIRDMDRALGRLLDGLAERGLGRRLALVFTSDHGEEMGEHGWWGWHSHTLYDELLRVPLVVRRPGGRSGGTRIAYQARGVDVAPTLLALAGLEAPPGLDGTDLLALVEGGEPAATRFAVAEIDGGAARALRSRRWKLYGDDLYDLVADPAERYDVAGRRPDVAGALADRLARAVAESREAAPGEAPVTLDPEAVERLRALGYLQ
ncbi:MAG TPA: sulfatase [Thermoanaerobaculia bacterium]|nr:sulfatase [Thermoanaerobaculia bacterium]